jgi:thiamine biosynthesis lipoprotein
MITNKLRLILIPSLALVFALSSCGNPADKPYSIYQGYAQGTTFHIELDGDGDYSTAIDSMLRDIDKELSLWDSASWISSWNSGNTSAEMGFHARRCWELSTQMHALSNGYFDPSLAPLIQFWGFGHASKGLPEQVDTPMLNQIRQRIGLNQVLQYDSVQGRLLPKTAGARLDFNAIAQGYSVDVLADFFEQKGHTNYMIEIGGEVRCRGKSPQGKFWKIGIDKPVSASETRALQAIVNLEGGLATSGSYRKHYEKDGRRYAHVINPKTGFPVSHQLVSVTVSAPTAAEADALATALLAMGTQPAIAFAQAQPNFGVFLIYDEQGRWQTWVSEKMKAQLSERLNN